MSIPGLQEQHAKGRAESIWCRRDAVFCAWDRTRSAQRLCGVHHVLCQLKSCQMLHSWRCENSHLKRHAVDEWPWMSLKVIILLLFDRPYISDVEEAVLTTSRSCSAPKILPHFHFTVNVKCLWPLWEYFSLNTTVEIASHSHECFLIHVQKCCRPS